MKALRGELSVAEICRKHGIDSGEQKEIASKYEQLQIVLQEELLEVSVYRIGEVLIDAYIIGHLPDGSYGGLKTKVVET